MTETKKPGNNSLLQIRDLTLNISDKIILNQLNIDFWEGHIHAIVGPNGTGKSSLAYTIMGLNGYREFEGELLFKNEKINNLSIDERAKMGITLTWQEPARYDGLKIRDFIKASAKDKSDENIKQILELSGLNPEDYINRNVDKTLSGGERKKIEIASILAMEPEFVMLDEPDSGIDIESLERIFDIIKILKEKGSTIVLITHSLAVLKQAEHAFLMCHGEIIEKGTIDKVIPYFENKCLPCIHKNFPEKDKQ